MYQYHKLLENVLKYGTHKGDRTGTGTISAFGESMRFNLAAGFPLITTKRMSFHVAKEELLWILRGETNVNSLQKKNVRIWDEWADEVGELGPVYGKQWRAWEDTRAVWDDEQEQFIIHNVRIDQIADVIKQIRTNPNSRRMVVSAWNPADVPQMKLPPCHMIFQFYVADGALSCLMYQRSCDVFLGVPYNIAGYALLTHMIAHVTDLEVGELVWMGGDVHIYSTHTDQVAEQLTRAPLALPSLWLNPAVKEIDQFTSDDINLIGYDHHPAIKGDVSV